MRSRLFEYLMYLCKRTNHRLDELDPNATSTRANTDKDTCPEGNQDMSYEQLNSREVLEHDEHIEQHLQWCVQHRLIAEVTILSPCSTYASSIVSNSSRSVEACI